MGNQIILWSLIIVPWLTLFLIKKEDLRRFMPVALFAALTSVMMHDIGLTLNWWVTKETAYPLHSLLPQYFGAFPVGVIWIFKYTYDRFWVYMASNVAFDFFAAYALIPFLTFRNTFSLIGCSKLQLFVQFLVHAVILYCYQKWQEGTLGFAVSTLNSPSVQPVANKPFLKDKDNKK